MSTTTPSPDLLAIKLSKIPARVFPSGRKPTITDIYLRPDSVVNPEIHPNLQLPFIFANYAAFVASGFRARKKEQEMSVTMAIFYWQLDQKRSFSTWHKDVRYNVLLAHIVLQTPNARVYMDAELVRFLEGFIKAWLESARRLPHDMDEARNYWIARCWRTGKYDLVSFGAKQARRMGMEVKKLAECVPEPQCAAEEF